MYVSMYVYMCACACVCVWVGVCVCVCVCMLSMSGCVCVYVCMYAHPSPPVYCYPLLPTATPPNKKVHFFVDTYVLCHKSTF